MIKLKKKHTILFALLDCLCAAAAWYSFFVFRKYFIDVDVNGYKLPVGPDQKLFTGLFFIPAYWLVIYFVSGSYTDVWRRSRLREISNTFLVSLVGVLILFFILLLDDKVTSYKDYYYTFFVLFSLHFGLTTTARIATATYVKSLLRQKIIGFNTIIVGNNRKTLNLVNEIMTDKISQGYRIIGYVSASNDDGALTGTFPYLGNYEELPDIYDMMSGSVRMNNVMGAALIEIKHEVLPQWQKVVKRLMDITVSLLVIIALLPVFLIIAIAVKMSSKGTVFFKQIRVGLYGKPFYIYKFRTMYVNAEEEGPALSKKNDKRITPIGKVLRKYRLDELPQFYNVLTGDMSLVGPRPERKYFIDQIIRIAPHYKQLHRVRPGITSWGQVKYGYAENVDEMVERLKFDILYIENMSLAVDFRIMIYTIKTILQGRGK